MIVVAIIGILAAIAVPKFASLLRKSNEGSTKGSLGGIRSALALYYADNEGQYPSDLGALTVGAHYMAAVPAVYTPDYHNKTALFEDNDDFGMGGTLSTDNGRWRYWNWTIGSSPRMKGDLWVGCSHTDTKSTSWSEY